MQKGSQTVGGSSFLGSSRSPKTLRGKGIFLNHTLHSDRYWCKEKLRAHLLSFQIGGSQSSLQIQSDVQNFASDLRQCQFYISSKSIGSSHRRRIDLEDKAKVVASDKGTESLPG